MTWRLNRALTRSDLQLLTFKDSFAGRASGVLVGDVPLAVGEKLTYIRIIEQWRTGMNFTGALSTRSLHSEHNKNAYRGVMPVYPSACFKSITPRRILMKCDMKIMSLEAAPIPHFLAEVYNFTEERYSFTFMVEE
jgi:hypothetical protein